MDSGPYKTMWKVRENQAENWYWNFPGANELMAAFISMKNENLTDVSPAALRYTYGIMRQQHLHFVSALIPVHQEKVTFYSRKT